jgi:hypothetical protein
MVYLPYTGIGSRKAPDKIITQMEEISKVLNSHGFTLRSGGANGADTSFEKYAFNKEIFLPWKNFNGRDSDYYTISKEACDIAAPLHPLWWRLSGAAKKLMARNVYQVLGFNLSSPTRFVICWTEDGCEHHSQRTKETGGTGMAISVASLNNIPVYNLANYQSLQDYNSILEIVLKGI